MSYFHPRLPRRMEAGDTHIDMGDYALEDSDSVEFHAAMARLSVGEPAGQAQQRQIDHPGAGGWRGSWQKH